MFPGSSATSYMDDDTKSVVSSSEVSVYGRKAPDIKAPAGNTHHFSYIHTYIHTYIHSPYHDTVHKLALSLPPCILTLKTCLTPEHTYKFFRTALTDNIIHTYIHTNIHTYIHIMISEPTSTYKWRPMEGTLEKVGDWAVR